MARHCSPVVHWAMPKAIEAVDTRLPHRDQLASFLLLARLFPLLPYSALNVASGVLGLPVKPFFWTLVLGSFPCASPSLASITGRTTDPLAQTTS